MLLTDWYKVGHPGQYHENMQTVYSNKTARKSRIPDIKHIVVAGIQGFVKRYLVEHFNENFFAREEEEVIREYSRRVRTSLGSDLQPLKHKFYTENFPGDPYGHIRHLHRLQHLPLKIKSLPEGSVVPIGVPFFTVVNDRKKHPELYWLTNFIETLMSASTWQGINSATVAHEYRKLFNEFAMETVGNVEFVPFQGHDFSFRGMSSLETAEYSGAAHLLSFVGTDTIPAIDFLEMYYNADAEKEMIGVSVAATEHAVMCSNTGFYVWDKAEGDWSRVGECEFEVFKKLITVTYPSGIVSIVCDTWDLWRVLIDYARRLKDEIMARDGKVVFRPDSGNPADILCGSLKGVIEYPKEHVDSMEKLLKWAEEEILDYVRENTGHGEHGPSEQTLRFKFDGKYYDISVTNISWNRHDKQYYYLDMWEAAKMKVEEVEILPEHKGVVELLWEIFEGTITEKGYRLLHKSVGTIYGDSISRERAREICTRLKEKGFASINWVAGIGSYTYQYMTRDTFGMAVKATYCEALSSDGTKVYEIPIFKDPITDDGTKKSAKGLLRVDEIVGEDGKPTYTFRDQVSWEEEDGGALETIFENGKIVKEVTLQQVRDRLSLWL